MINFRLKTITSLYIAAKSVYVVQAQKSLWGAHLVKFGRAEIQAPALTPAAEPSKENTQALIAAVRRVIRESNITSKNVITALPGKDVLIRYFQMPKIPKAEWDTAIKFECKKYIPFKIEELLWDFHVVAPKNKSASRMDVTFAAVKKELAQKHIALLKEAGLEVQVLEPAPFSLVRLLTASKQLPKNKATAIVDVDHGIADINIVKNNICFLTRDVSLPLEEELVFDNLLNEVRMSLDYYEKLFPTEIVNKILLSGEVELKDWDKNLAADLKLSVEKIKSAKAMKFKRAAPSLSMNVAVGLALRGQVKNSAEINLCQLREQKTKTFLPKEALEFTPEIRQAIFSAVIFSAIGLLIIYLAMFSQIAKQKKELERVISLRPTISLSVGSLSYKKIESLEGELKGKLAQLSQIIDKRTYWTNKLDQIPKMIVPGMWLTNLTIAENPEKNNKLLTTLTINGVAFHEDPVQEIGMITKLVSDLKENEEFARGFKEIKLDSMDSGEYNQAAIKNFTISCKN